MPPPLPGQVFQDVEPSVTAGLVRRGASVRLSPTLDNDFKIDVLVEHVRNGPSNAAPIGLQITQSFGNDEKARTFVREASKWPGIGPLLYAEVIGPVTRELLTALRDALLALWSDPVRLGRKAWRVTVYANGNITWYLI